MSVTFGSVGATEKIKRRHPRETTKNKTTKHKNHIPEYCSIHFCSLFLISQIAAVLSHDPLTNIFGSVGFIETLITSPL